MMTDDMIWVYQCNPGTKYHSWYQRNYSLQICSSEI